MTEHENEAQSAPENIIESVHDLIEMMNKGGIGELNLKTEDFKIRLRTEAVALAAATPVMSMPPAYSMPPMPGMAPSAEQDASVTPIDEPAAIDGHVVTSPMIGTFYSMPPMPGMAPSVEHDLGSTPIDEPAEKDGHVVTSPMIGTFYSASAPGEPAYVQIGDEVETGQVVGIIEAMKIMNEITADQSGVVTELLVDNAEAVEYGSPLIRISNSSSAALD